jgi:hypothetical protein
MWPPADRSREAAPRAAIAALFADFCLDLQLEEAPLELLVSR